MFAALLTGSALIFAGGLSWLARFVPADRLLISGLLPFIPGDLLKSALASAVFPAAWRLVHRLTGKDE
jgi:biotin transport system substrate-specific component